MAGDSDSRFVYNIVMLPLTSFFYILAFQTLDVSKNRYINNIHAIIAARSLAVLFLVCIGILLITC